MNTDTGIEITPNGFRFEGNLRVEVVRVGPPAQATQPMAAEAQDQAESAKTGAHDGGAAMLGAIHDCAKPDLSPVGRVTASEATQVAETAEIASSGDIFPIRLGDSADVRPVLTDDWFRTADAWVGDYLVRPGNYLARTAASDEMPDPALDPTPQEQRTMFEQLIAEGRPSTVEVKATLEGLRELHDWALDCGWHSHAVTAAKASGALDRLGCALIAQDAEVEALNKALDTVARAAVPLSDTDHAELIAKARTWIETAQATYSPDHTNALRTPTDLIAKLVAATLDQARKAQALSEKVWTFDITKPLDARNGALLAMDVLGNFADGTGPLTRSDASRMVASIRVLLHHAHDLEVHRDAARDALSDVEADRDGFQAGFTMAIRERDNARARIEALRADLHRVQTNTAQYRQESRGREAIANRQREDAERWTKRRAEVVNQLMRPNADVEAILRIRPEDRTGAEAAEVALWQHECTGNALRFVAELATMTDTEADFLDGSELREVARMLQVPDEAGERAPTVPRVYGDEDRRRAIDTLQRMTGGPGAAGRAVAESLVDTIAEALGMRRA